MAKYCSNCGKDVHEEAVVCPNCGVLLNHQNHKQKGNKKLVVGIVIVFIIAFLGVLMGLNGGSSSAIIGEWQAIGIYDEDDFKALSSSRQKGIYAIFRDDDTCKLSLNGAELEGTWREYESKENVFILTFEGMDLGRAGVTTLESSGKTVLVITFPTMDEMTIVYEQK